MRLSPKQVHVVEPSAFSSIAFGPQMSQEVCCTLGAKDIMKNFMKLVTRSVLLNKQPIIGEKVARLSLRKVELHDGKDSLSFRICCGFLEANPLIA